MALTPPSRVHRAYLTRVANFSAAHTLQSDKLTEKENVEIYGKCNNPNGHGHNYKVEVTVFGDIDATTGMVINLTDLNSYINEAVVSVLDHKNIDLDVPYFRNGVVSTVENIAVFIWHQMRAFIPDLLYEVKVHETDKNIAVYRGD
jgi:6-pyruvoyltetrahydropterin/6-carboxytetrahydropterin synthase